MSINPSIERRRGGIRCTVARDVANELEALANRDIPNELRDSDRALLYAIADAIRRINLQE